MKKGRWWFILLLLIVMIVAIVVRLTHLHVVDQSVLEQRGDARAARHLSIHKPRGVIVDRTGKPLAMSLPVNTIWVDPQQVSVTNPHWLQVLKLLRLDADPINQKILSQPKSRFMYLKRQVSPSIAQRIQALQVSGVYAERDTKRFYPMGEAALQLIGMTNVDNVGTAGVEQYYNHWLSGIKGQVRVERDLKGNIVQAETDQEAKAGKALALSIDRQIQYLTYRALKAAVSKHKAAGGAAVIMDVQTGEVLAMASLPSFNPNNPSTFDASALRNRVVTDVLEPGSVVKPLAMSAVLNSNTVPMDAMVDTAPGRWRVGGHIVRDTRNYGELTLPMVIKKSSNVGISRLVLTNPDPMMLPNALHHFGFGQRTGIGFPGERSGVLRMHQQWSPFALATLSFGYGISVTPLQLAKAYAVIANHGLGVKPTLLVQKKAVPTQQVLQPEVAASVRQMLQQVVKLGGTGYRARIDGFNVAGKTGTARKAGNGGYLPDSYTAVFVGLMPAESPQVVMAIVVDDPRGDAYYGGTVAAPVFAEVMPHVMRLLHISPIQTKRNSA